ncbi:LL-diaminopimelate aminotransferase chloroplastic [Zea mays]|uniref:LL-diaminopimelate aminotransferase chloroplastic n=1 Tax=Zea mays TaxID=4577 RepID=A0A1D6MQJ6_MAIZE|nr:LL-diaminopimelate aminotransferase chloroplastic [Zea mays]
MIVPLTPRMHRLNGSWTDIFITDFGLSSFPVLFYQWRHGDWRTEGRSTGLQRGGKARSSRRQQEDVIDGDLCEQYPSLPADMQRKIADELDRTPTPAALLGEDCQGGRLEQARAALISDRACCHPDGTR